MKPFFLTLAILLLYAAPDLHATDPKPLAFYIVSEKKVEGWRFIDTPEFPKLGYIAAVPGLVVTRLESVKADVSRSFESSVDKDGKVKLESMRESPAIVIGLRPDDARKFTAITGQAIRKRMLIMLGETPLMAPNVNAAITTTKVQLTLRTTADRKSLVEELTKLTK